MGENDKPVQDPVLQHDLPETSLELETGHDGKPPPDRTEVPLRPVGPDLIFDEQLTSAATPFLYLLSVILIAVIAYLLYIFVGG